MTKFKFQNKFKIQMSKRNIFVIGALEFEFTTSESEE